MSDKHPKVDEKKTFVMKHKDRVSFIYQLTPIMDGPYLGNAYRFDGKWLNATCWRWAIFYEPIELNKAFELYPPEKKKTRAVKSSRPVARAKPKRKLVKCKPAKHKKPKRRK